MAILALNNINDNPRHLVTGFLFKKLIIHSSHSVTLSCKQLHPLLIDMEFKNFVLFVGILVACASASAKGKQQK